MSSWEKIAREGNNLTQNRKCIKSRLSKEQNQNSSGVCCLPRHWGQEFELGPFLPRRSGMEELQTTQR